MGRSWVRKTYKISIETIECHNSRPRPTQPTKKKLAKQNILGTKKKVYSRKKNSDKKIVRKEVCSSRAISKGRSPDEPLGVPSTAVVAK